MPKRKKATQRGQGLVQDAHAFVKNNKLISRGLGLLSFPGAGLAAKGAAMLGYGKKRKRKRTRVVAAPLLGPTISAVPRTVRLPPSRAVGKVMIGRGQVGSGIFSDIGGGIGNIFGGLGGGVGSIARGMFGGGAQRNVIKTN